MFAQHTLFISSTNPVNAMDLRAPLSTTEHSLHYCEAFIIVAFSDMNIASTRARWIKHRTNADKEQRTYVCRELRSHVGMGHNFGGMQRLIRNVLMILCDTMPHSLRGLNLDGSSTQVARRYAREHGHRGHFTSPLLDNRDAQER